MKTINLHQSQIFFELPQKIALEGSVLIITDTQVAPFHLQDILSRIQAMEIFTLVLENGEQSKNFQTLQHILSYALQCKLDRKSTMIALGGGVITDLVGLASGLFMRGIDFISIPTTLLAQVDASVGGKCGINTQEGKNLIGLFHQPKRVYLSTMFLNTLPKREFDCAFAEIIKMAVCLDASLFEKLFNPQTVLANLIEIIYTCVKLKAQVVELDEKERGLRSVLNYGHTFGHIIEKEGNYQTFLHGEAVGLGMVLENILAQKILGFSDSQKIKDLLELYSLKTHYRISCPSSFYQQLFLDKKTENKQIKFILPKKIGAFEFVYPTQDEIMEVLLEAQ